MAQHFFLKNKNNISATVSNYGARLVSFTAPDVKGNIEDIVLGYDTIEDELSGDAYFGATVGRYANRIASGKFSLDGKEFNLAMNSFGNALHGGAEGYHCVVWDAEQNGNKVVLKHRDLDMHEGYPGNVDVTVTYELTDDNELIISYEALSDKKTPFNITNHAYFNLKGAGNGDILDHKLTINADKFTPMDMKQIPTGEILEVKNTPFDFTELTAIGKNIDTYHEGFKFVSGFDHNWVINGKLDELKFAARVLEPTSGRVLEVFTTEPGVQLYTGNSVNERNGRGGKPYFNKDGFCLETQHFPDSPNHPKFPTTIIESGVIFNSKTIYKVGVVD